MKTTARIEKRLQNRYGRMATAAAFDSAYQNVAELNPGMGQDRLDLAAMRQAASLLADGTYDAEGRYVG